MYCLQARLCTIHPGNFTGCSSEGVNQLNVLLIVGDKVTRQHPQTTMLEERRANCGIFYELKNVIHSYVLNALPVPHIYIFHHCPRI